MYKIAYGVYNQYSDINYLPMYLKLKGATLFYLERLSNHLVSEGKNKLYYICSNSIEEILKDTTNKGFDYCVIQAAGCMLKSYSIHYDIEQLIKENRFGVAGHPLMHPGKWIELNNQFFIVNLKAWAECGQPNYGDWNDGPTLLPVVTRSEGNFHHDYTPLWVKPTGNYAIQTGAGTGWELVASFMAHSWPVITLPESIRFGKFYSYPDHETREFEQSIKTLTTYPDQNWNQAKLVNDALTVKDQIWLFNSEDMEIPNQGTYNLVVNTASGFKLFDFFKNNRLADNAKCIVYDFNPKSIKWYQQLYSWPNEDLLSCIRQFSDRDNFTWIGQCDSIYTENHSFWDKLNSLYQYFGGQELFAEYWKKFKSMPVKFVQADLYKEPEQFAELFVGAGKKWVNITNIFSTDATQIIYGHVECMAAQYKLLGSLFVVDPEIDITLFDYWGRTKFGKLKDIL